MLKDKISEIFMKYVESCKNLLLIYLIFTVICIVLDVIDFIVQFVRFGRAGDEYSELMMLFIVVIFLGLDVFYFIWVMQVKTKVRPEMAAYLSKALFGFVTLMKTQLVSNAKNIKNGNINTQALKNMRESIASKFRRGSKGNTNTEDNELNIPNNNFKISQQQNINSDHDGL